MLLFSMTKNVDVFVEKKFFLKEAFERWDIDEKTYKNMLKQLDYKNKEISKNREKHGFRHSKSTKIVLIILGFIVLAALFMNMIKIRLHIWGTVWI